MTQSECPPLCLTATAVAIIGLFVVGPSVQSVALFVVGMLGVYAGHAGRWRLGKATAVVRTSTRP